MPVYKSAELVAEEQEIVEDALNKLAEEDALPKDKQAAKTRKQNKELKRLLDEYERHGDK